MQGELTTSPPKTPAVATRKFRILVVDDDRDSVDLLSQWLTMGGYEVTTAATGQEALRRVPADRPDLVLLDLLIPPPDGLQVMRAIKRDRVLSTIPVVVMTVKRDVKSKVECLKNGADDFIVKPFHFDELDAVLRSSLKKRYLYTPLERANQQLRDANDRLLKLTVTDERTNLLNDRYPKRRLAEEFKRAQRYGTPLSVTMLDLDHFKQVNDKYGHDCGDQVLREFGKLLTENARTTDIVGRYGGGGGLIVLPHTHRLRPAPVPPRPRQAAPGDNYPC